MPITNSIFSCGKAWKSKRAKLGWIWRVFRNFSLKIFQQPSKKVSGMWTCIVLHQNDNFCQQSWSLGLDCCIELHECVKTAASSSSVLTACFRIDCVGQIFQQSDSFSIPKQHCHHFTSWRNFKHFGCWFCRGFPYFACFFHFQGLVMDPVTHNYSIEIIISLCIVLCEKCECWAHSLLLMNIH